MSFRVWEQRENAIILKYAKNPQTSTSEICKEPALAPDSKHIWEA